MIVGVNKSVNLILYANKLINSVMYSRIKSMVLNCDFGTFLFVHLSYLNLVN